MTRVSKAAKTLPTLFFVISALTLATGCSTLRVKIPGPLIESPELPGEKGKMEFGAGVDDAKEHVFVQDASRRPPKLNEPNFNRRDYYIYGRGGYSVADWLELGARYIPGGGSWGIGLLGGVAGTFRAQVIGTGGQTPGWKVAIYGGAFFTHTGIGGDQNGDFGAGGYDWSAQASAFTTSLGTSLGYRFPDQKLLVFLAYSYADQRAEGKIDHRASDNGTSPAATYQLSAIGGNGRTLGLGLRMGESFVWGLDARLIDQSWANLGTPDAFGGGNSREAMILTSFSFVR